MNTPSKKAQEGESSIHRTQTKLSYLPSVKKDSKYYIELTWGQTDTSFDCNRK